jgi:hypothetical protein
MEALLETIGLDAEESHELLFRVKVEGADPEPAKVRLVCESGDVGYVFAGHPTSEEGVVQFLVPVMKGRLKEGTYLSRVEVLIGSRYFAPVQFQLEFKQTMKVVAEAIHVVPKAKAPQVTVSAAPVVVAKPAPTVRVEAPKPLPIAEEKKPVTPQKKPATAPAAPQPRTLRERYQQKDAQEDDADAVRRLVRSFIKEEKRKP